MGYDSLMIDRDERIEVRGMRGPRSGSGPGRRPERTLRWIGESRRENFEIFDFDLGQPERDEIDLLPTDVRTANPPWAPDWNA